MRRGIIPLMDLLRSYAEPILTDINENKQWCDTEYLEAAYEMAMSVEGANVFASFILLIPIAKHPKTPKHIIKELIYIQYTSVSWWAKRHPSVQNYMPFG